MVEQRTENPCVPGSIPGPATSIIKIKFMTENKTKNTQPNFEEALTELQTIVKDIETGKDGLDDMLKKYERGNELRLICEKRLQEAKLTLEKIKKTADS